MKNNFFVFDTNTLLSALLKDAGIPAQALKKARTKGTLVISDEVAAEYIEVFSRKKFDAYVPLLFRLAFIENIITNSLPIVIGTPILMCRDPKDDKFLSLAFAANAECIISGDNDLLTLQPFHDISIMKPADFVNSFHI